MVNEVILKYFKDNLGKFSRGVLRSKLISSGHQVKDVDDTLAFLDLEKSKILIPKTTTPLKTIQPKTIPVKPHLADSAIIVKQKPEGFSLPGKIASLFPKDFMSHSKFIKFSSFSGFLILGIIFLSVIFSFIFPIDIPRILMSLIGSLIALLTIIYYLGFSRLGKSLNSKKMRSSALFIVVSILLFMVIVLVNIFYLPGLIFTDIITPFLEEGVFLFSLPSIILSFLSFLSILFFIISRYVLSIDLINYSESLKFSKFAGVFSLVWMIFTTGVFIGIIYSGFQPGIASGFLSNPQMHNVFLTMEVLYGVVFATSLFLESLTLLFASKKFEV